jgi:hypothetical protein
VAGHSLQAAEDCRSWVLRLRQSARRQTTERNRQWAKTMAAVLVVAEQQERREQRIGDR